MIRLARLMLVLVVALAVAGCPPATTDNRGGDNKSNKSGNTPSADTPEPTVENPKVPAEGQPVRIAVCGPITGPAAAFGDMIVKAAKLKEKQINDAGGLKIGDKQYKIEFKTFDDKADTAEATNVARQVVNDDSLVAVVGHFNSTCTKAAKDEYNRVGIVEFSPGSTNVEVCVGGPYTFRNLYRDDYQGDQIAVYMASVLGLEKAAVLYDADDYGTGLKNSFVTRAAEFGLTATEIAYQRERTQDFKPLVQQAKAAGAQAIFVAGLYNEAALITKAARGDLKMEVPIMGGDGVMSPDYIRLAGEHAEAALITTPFLFNTGNDSKAAKDFLAAFNGAYGKDPDTWAALTYDACGQILHAISRIGCDRKAIRDYLAWQTSEKKGYKGVTGNTYFDNEGDCYSKPVFLATVRGGKFVPAEKQMVE